MPFKYILACHSLNQLEQNREKSISNPSFHETDEKPSHSCHVFFQLEGRIVCSNHL